MQPMMQNSPAVPMPEYTEQGNDQDYGQAGMAEQNEDQGAESMQMLQQGISQLSPQELQRFDVLITPELAQLIIKMFPAWAPVFMQFAGGGGQQMQQGAPIAQSPMRNFQAS